ncbi:hypothetical protein [Thermococcus sp.]|uniref:hypothetical protein n=1 Tax=Thermococcus sp. TaxID=35749 RepID=UPI00262B8A2F|nr:hypothetical protein [Thermococcus sp.]
MPKLAKLELSVGKNRGKVNIRTGKVSFEIGPLPDEYFLGKPRELVRRKAGEEAGFSTTSSLSLTLRASAERSGSR